MAATAAMAIFLFLDERGRLCLALESIGKRLGRDGDWTTHQLRDVVALQQLAVIVGVFSWQLKGLCGIARLVYMGEEGTGEVTIIAAAAEHNPAAVAAPSMIGLRM